MSDVDKKLDITVAAKDEASRVMDQVAANARKNERQLAADSAAHAEADQARWRIQQKIQDDLIRQQDGLAERARRAAAELRLVQAATPEARQQVDHENEREDRAAGYEKDAKEFAAAARQKEQVALEAIAEEGAARAKLVEGQLRADAAQLAAGRTLSTEQKAILEEGVANARAQVLKETADLKQAYRLQTEERIEEYQRGLAKIAELEEQAAISRRVQQTRPEPAPAQAGPGGIAGWARQQNMLARANGDVALERLLRGGGALGLFTLVGDGLKDLTAKMVELNKEFEKGEVDAAGVAVEIGKSIPMLGGFVAAGQNIRELLTHEKQQIDDINQEIRAGNELMELRLRIQRDQLKAQEDLAERQRKATEELKAAQAGPLEKPIVEGANRLADIQAQRLKDQRDYADKRREDEKAELEAIRKAGEARKKVLQDDARASASVNERLATAAGGKGLNAASAQALADRISAAAAQADAVTNSQVNAAEARAKADIANHSKGLDDVAATERQTVIANATSSWLEKTKKEVEDFAKFSAERIRKGLSPGDAGDQLARDTEDALARSKEQQLRISGNALEADLMQLRRAHEKRLEEIRRQAQEEVAVAKSAPEVSSIRAKQAAAKTAENDSFQFESDRLTHDDRLTKQEKHQEIMQALQQGRIDQLEKEADLGNRQAKREADQLKVAQEYARKKEEIVRLSRNASEADKRALQAELDKLNKEEFSAEAAAGLADIKSQIKSLETPVRYAGFEDFRKTGGVMDAQRERDRTSANIAAQQLAKLEAQLQALDEISLKINAMVAWILDGDSSYDPNLS
jgi:hypothetical protein